MIAPNWVRARMDFLRDGTMLIYVTSICYIFSVSSMPPPPPSNQSPVAVKRDGKLIASGIMMIIQASITLIVGLFFFSVSQSDGVVGWLNDVSGGTITFIALITLAMGTGLLWTGIGTIKNRGWARIATIVLQSIFTVLILVGAVSGDGSASGALVPLIWAGTILGLAIAGKTD